MGMMQKVKGALGERELRDKLRELFPGYAESIVRGQQFFAKGDCDVKGLPGLHLECKRAERLNIYNAVEQAVHDAKENNIPLVCHRRNRGEWIAIARLKDLIHLAEVIYALIYSESEDGQEDATLGKETMKALTICQPDAHLVCLPDEDHRAKRVDNREWPTNYRGPLLIHAAKTRCRLKVSADGLRDENHDIPIADMDFGAVVAVANLAMCYSVNDGRCVCTGESVTSRFPWLRWHPNVEGPYGFVLTDVHRFAEPVPCRGTQGLFDVPHDLVADQLAQLPASWHAEPSMFLAEQESDTSWASTSAQWG